jgi:hypothetical protein
VEVMVTILGGRALFRKSRFRARLAPSQVCD